MANYCKTFAHRAAVLLLLPAVILSSCQEGSDAGSLLGQWRLEGSPTQYLSFSGSVTLLRSVGKAEVFGNFQQHGDSLFLQFHSIYAHPSDTAAVVNLFGPQPIDDIRLKVMTLDGGHLVLGNGQRLWNFCYY